MDFAWTKCAEADVHERLLIKERSLEIGLSHCENLIDEVSNRFSNIAEHCEPSMEIIWALEDRNEWINQCREIARDHRDFRVPVGVAGATGSGKTSVLNALLGFQELLPTNNEEAATAVQCKVSFNYDNRPKYAFRCHITFRSKEALKAELKQFFDNLKLKDELEELNDDSADGEEALCNLEMAMQPTREMISIVFDLEDDEIQELDLDGVLNSNTEALKLLGTTKEFNHRTADGISQMVKPYMDSTAEDHGATGTSFAAWPLIEQVELFVKSDILLNGVILVDLPGLGDAVRSRAIVAEKAFDQLTATIIVSQATRAADNSTAVNLMSKHQEMALILDGRLHKQAFCVCLSQIDHIDRKAALRKPDAKANEYLQELLGEEEDHRSLLGVGAQAKKKLSKVKRKEQRKLSRHQELHPKGKAAERIKAQAAYNATRKRFKKVLKDINDSRRRLEELEGEIIFICIRARNQYLNQRIQQDFRKRHARLLGETPDMQKTYDAQVAVCPTSSAAFWKCKCPFSSEPGFPDELYTGIPGLAKWIRDATIQKREEHVNGLLNRLQVQYNTIKLWVQDKRRLKDTPLTRDWFETHILADAIESLEEDLEVYWPTLTEAVEDQYPLDNVNRELILHEGPGKCIDAVKGWSYKKSGNGASAKMHHNTYQAILTRKGGKFMSVSNNTYTEYFWMGDLSHVLFSIVVKDWTQALHIDIPSMAGDAELAIDKIWDRFIQDLNARVNKAEPRLLPQIKNEEPNLEAFKKAAKTRIRQALKRLSKGAGQAYPLVAFKAQEEWAETFKGAVNIRGTGSHAARQQLVLNFAKKNSRNTLEKIYDYLDEQLCANFGSLPEELQSISDDTVRSLRSYLIMFIDKTLESTDMAIKSEDVAEEKIGLRMAVNSELDMWDAQWGNLDLDEYVNDKQAGCIPDEYQHARSKLEASDDSTNSDSSSEESTDED
ncbi:hypothetical protein F5B22DRAFT_657903 [Xylaria bambusicola]|uniref:uncharacterized protein n=1 Tax=Xylaria bambusicola TaxID=326684 RepID=UPI0020084062|nr:uncharacterized protein F5B22DRAFT_657903 [Xylaria bambusicola]KAI0509709.1 hypothetical protein F5B22DRAFT_657903 [Xylaria bambusicola]